MPHGMDSLCGICHTAESSDFQRILSLPCAAGGWVLREYPLWVTSRHQSGAWECLHLGQFQTFGSVSKPRHVDKCQVSPLDKNFLKA
jgi:hypothetical protein